MEEYKIKYAEVLLNSCLKVEKNQPLFISFPIERIDFVKVVSDVAKRIGINDIYYDVSDPYLKHDLLKELEVDELKKLPYWNKDIWNIYAKKNAAFLMLSSEYPGLMNDILPTKISELTKYAFSTRKEFDNLRDKLMISWTIAAVPTYSWAKELFPNSDTPVDNLWDKIFDICSIKDDNPVHTWQKKIDMLNERAEKLNSYNFKSLKYVSDNGTNFSINLPEDHVWVSGMEKLSSGKEVLVNFPTEEIFTSPDCNSAEGIVYSSKPLSYQGVLIDKFNIRFSKGEVVEYHALIGEKTLGEMINICPNSNKLGEVALVPYDSPISNSNIVFLETLYDENAACHLALGDSFVECNKNGMNFSKDVLYSKYSLNKCDSHVDFMIGNSSLNIIGITKDGREIPIFKNGNFSELF